MVKVLVTLPNSIAGTLILKGFAEGFRECGSEVLVSDLRELTVKTIAEFKPDMVFGYDYGFLFYENSELNDCILNCGARLVHYFADEPWGNFAVVNNPKLYEDYSKLAREGKVISYIWDKDCVAKLPNSNYLPLAVDTKKYSTSQCEKKYDISFVGRPLSKIRQKYLAQVVKQFGSKLNIFSYETHFLRSVEEMKEKNLLTQDELEVYKNTYRGFLRTEEELAKVYAESRVNLNITLQGVSNLNYRVFEVLASSGFLLTDKMNDLNELFEIGRDLEVYLNEKDCLEKIEYYLNHPQKCLDIARMGRETVIKNHTYVHRAKNILDDMQRLRLE